MPSVVVQESVRIFAGSVVLDGDLRLPEHPAGLVIFAHGSGSSRRSPRNRAVASALEANGFATLLLDLVTREEESQDTRTGEHRFDIELLGRRVIGAADWAQEDARLQHLNVAFFGASTGAAAALVAAAARPRMTRAVISRGGRPDLGGDALPRVQAPTLLIVGGADKPILDLNRDALQHMRAPVELQVVSAATHRFEEPGALEEVASLPGVSVTFPGDRGGCEPSGAW